MKTMVFLQVALVATGCAVAGGQARREVSGIGSLRAIIVAELAYSTNCGNGGYAITLEDLARPPRAGGSGFVSPDLATNGTTVGGYRFTLKKGARQGVSEVSTAAATCNGSAGNPVNSFFASAEPVQSSTGDRYFAADERAIIFYSTKPIPNPIVESATVVQLK